MRSRATLAMAILVTALACASRPIPTVPTSAPGDLAARARRAGELIRSRFLSPEGILVYRRSVDSPPNLESGPYGNLADGACWSGYYLGACALRFAAEQSAEAEADLDRALAGVESLFEATGQPGLLCRSIDRNLTDEQFSARSGEWRPAALPGYHYRGDVSKDQIAGVLFGLGCVVYHCGTREYLLRARRLLEALADRLDAADLGITDAGGRVTSHGDLSPRYLGFPVAANAAVVLAAFRLSAAAGGPPRHLERYRELVEDGYARDASHAAVRVFGKTNRNNDHMATGCLYPLFMLEDELDIRELYRRGLARVARPAREEGNAWFLGLSMAASGTDPDLVAIALDALLRLPLEKRSGPVDLRGKVRGPVPVELRPATAFVWRSDPYRLVKDPDGIRPVRDYAPLDYYAAYWLLRAHGIIGE